VRTLGVITARGGSKRLPRKNMRDLCGSPLIYWSIAAGYCLDELVVTTDDDEIAEFSRAQDCTVVRRPNYLSGDNASSIEAVRHAVAEAGEDYDTIVLLQPTSPLRHAGHVQEALALMAERSADAVFSVTDCAEETAFQLRHAQRLEALPRVVVPNGALYIIRRDRLEAGHSWYEGEVFGYRMDKDVSIDVDTAVDMEVAALLLGRRLKEHA
jgi:CMP-N,N'-diacetyllegionaminic acid synthase